MLLLPRHVPEGPCGLPEDEFAARLVRLVPSLDATDRAELLHALFPVPSATAEEPTASVVALAVTRLRTEGLLKERTNEFLLRHPVLSAKLEQTPAAPSRTFAFLEATAWVLAFVLGSLASVRAFAASPSASTHRGFARPLVALAAMPRPAADPPSEPARPRPARAGTAPAQTPGHTLVVQTRSAGTTPPHPRRTPFHNVDFSHYFPPLRRRAPTVVAMDPPPAPAPSPTPAPRPRVHSLFGPIFGPRGH